MVEIERGVGSVIETVKLGLPLLGLCKLIIDSLEILGIFIYSMIVN